MVAPPLFPPDSLFPAASPVIENFQRVDGSLGANWINPAFSESALTISGNAVASTAIAGVSASAMWIVPVARVAAIYCQVTVLPISPNFVTLGLKGAGGSDRLYVQYTAASGGGIGMNWGSFSIGSFNAGSWMGMTLDTSYALTSYTKTGNAPWVVRSTVNIAFLGPDPRASWNPYVSILDPTARVTNIGFEQVPSGYAAPAYGRGAC